MEVFSGFPAGRMSYTPLPDVFFSELLPAIDDLLELKLFLYCFWRIQKQRGPLRFLTREMLANDPAVQRDLARLGVDPDQKLDWALSRAVSRKALLVITMERDGLPVACYFLNTEEGRRAVGRIQRGEAVPWVGAEPIRFVPSEGSTPDEARPNIFVLYEQTIGLLQPIIADELRDAEQSYPAEWIEEAFRIAAERNVRHWRYVRAILRRWSTEGRHDERGGADAIQDGRRYIRGPYADYIEH